MPGTNEVPYSTCTFYFPAPFLAPAAFYSLVCACFAVNRGSCSGACCSAWLSWRNVNVMSVPDLFVLGHKNLSIVCGRMYSRLGLPPRNTLGINLLQKQIAGSKTCPPVRLSLLSFLGQMFAPAWDSICFLADKNICLALAKGEF